jgi:hypothetical protein
VLKSLLRNVARLLRSNRSTSPSRRLTNRQVEGLERRQLLANVLTATFEHQTSDIRMVYTFDADMRSDLQASDLSMNNATLDSFLTGASLTFENNGTKATFRFPTYVNEAGVTGVIPFGFYRAILSEDDVQSLSADHRIDFPFAGGDTDDTGYIDGDDYARVDNGYNFALSGWNNGDFTFESSVNGEDYAIIDNAFNTGLHAPPEGPGVLNITETTVESVRMGWLDNINPPHNETGWRVQRSADGVNFAVVKNFPANTQVWLDDPAGNPGNSPLDGRKHWYRVRAVNDIDPSYGTAYTPKVAALTAMRKPINLTATAASATAIDLSWTNDSASATQFRDNDAGMNQLAFQLRNDPDEPFYSGPGNPSLRVRRISEWDDDTPDLRWNGQGNPNNHDDNLWEDESTWAQTLEDLATKNIRDIAVVGYSHGGALARRIVERLHRDHGTLDLWHVRYSAYVDAVRRDTQVDPNPFTDSETRIPIYNRGQVQNVHDSHYNTHAGSAANPFRGGPVNGAAQNVPYENEIHATIDNDAFVHNAVRTRIRGFVQQ